MDEKIIQAVKEALKKNQAVKSDDSLFYKNQETIKISEDNFHDYGESSEKIIAFVDGGNAELIKTPGMSISFIRTFAVIMQKNRRLKDFKEEFYLLATAESKNNSIIYKAKIFGKDSSDYEIDSFDESIREGSNRASISSIQNLIRRFSEIRLAAKISKEYKNMIIVLDGSLKADYPNESMLLEELYSASESNNNIVAALSKTSSLLTKSGKPFITQILSIAKKEKWYYHPIIKLKKEDYKAESAIAKLNKSSKHAFKIEVHQPEHLKEAIEALASNSVDSVFPGYPYGLIFADKSARVSNEEKEYLTTILTEKLKTDISMHLSALNAHGILDNIG